MKSYQNSFNHERVKDSHFQSKSYARIKIPDEENSNYDISDDRKSRK